MTHLLGIAMLLTLLAPQQQKLPDAFYELPEQVREQATLIVTGTYHEGRSPCIWRPDGMRYWALQSSIRITKVYRGEVGGKFIYLSKTSLVDRKAVDLKIGEGHRYLVLLRPSEKSMKAIRAGEYLPFWDALEGEEIVAIVEVK